mgnify:CR=1 FL=1
MLRVSGGAMLPTEKIMKMHLPVIVTTAVATLAIAVLVGSITAPNQALAQQAAPGDNIAERLAALEKAIVRNPDSPRDTVLARLGAIEQLLQDQTKQAEKATGDVRKGADAAEAEQDRMDRRLKILENKATENARTDLNDELKDLKKDIAGFNQTIKDLSDRIRKLEQRL